MLGFDIGSAQLKIVQWNGTAVTKMVAVDMPDNMIKNDAIISYDAMADFIKETLKQNGLREKKAALILPSQIAFLRRLTVPYMTMDQLSVNLPYEFRDFLSDNKDKYYYDSLFNEVINDEEGKPKELDIYASAVSKEIIEDYKGMFRRAGLKLLVGIPQEIPFVNLLSARKVEKTSECAILDIGHMASRLEIFTGSTFEVSRVIDMGLKDLDIAIAERESVDEHVARTYKITNHNNVQESDEAQRVYAAIAADVRKTINFYSFSNRESNLQSLYICGGGANVPELVRTISEAVDLEVRDIHEILPEIRDEEQDPAAFAAAIGATLQSVKAGTDNLNVVIKEKSQLPLGKTIAGVVLVLAAAAAFSKFLVYDRFMEVSRIEAQANAVQKEHDGYMEYLTDYDEIAAEYAKYSSGWMTDQEKARVDRTDILDVIDKELKCEILDISITENVATVRITGCTLDQVSKYVEKIMANEKVASVKMTSAVTDNTPTGLQSATIIFSMKKKGGEQ